MGCCRYENISAIKAISTTDFQIGHKITIFVGRIYVFKIFMKAVKILISRVNSLRKKLKNGTQKNDECCPTILILSITIK